MRGFVALLGLACMVLGQRWAITVLDVEDGPIRPEHLAQASSADLVGVAIISVPLLAVGVLIVARAAFFGITCTNAEIKVHQVIRTRRVPTERVIEVRRTWAGKTDLWWKGEKGWPRWTRIPAFSLSPLARQSVRQWLEPYNEQCVGTLRRWIDERRLE
ncbi:hypothetical protein ABZ897_44085 [Nonomuraea sp. NPDC046802]|uniref:hypothetical protein n=1 Tax=Nonomuraea sp. NPDC046802 TaxID=3154919 RepID=UPI0033D5F064